MSEEKSRASHPVEDLSVLSRRGALSAADQRSFASTLDASLTLATAHQLGLDFDQVAAVRPGDDALIAEVAARAVSRGRPAGFARFRLRGLLLVATLALAGTATAFWELGRAPASVPPLASSGSAASVAQTRRPVPPAARAVAAARASAAEPEASARAVDRPVARSAISVLRAPSARAEEPGARTFDSAEALFREASASRRSGDPSLARALYLRLEHDFPASDEAHLAHVSLGNLLLTMGRPAEAERQFASYLGGRPALAQEALVGRAQSLAALGSSADEQRVWEGLLHDYPNSLYSAQARQRLAELARSAARPE